VQHPQLTSPTLIIADTVIARPLETDQPNRVLAKPDRGKRPAPDDQFLLYEILERALIAVFTVMLLSTTVRHLPMMVDFLTYLYLMAQRFLGAILALL
jgi:hypothetical protein